MIKDDFTRDLKDKLLEEIRIAKVGGRKRGFFLCKDETDKIVLSKPCEGEECSITIEDPLTICSSPSEFKGDIHIEPYIYSTKKDYQRKGIIVPPENKLKERIIKNLKKTHEDKGVGELPIVPPSYTNSLNTLLLKCFRNTDAMTCIGTDINENKIECWSPKVDIKKGQCIRALYDQKRTRKKEMFPKKWIVPLFNKEIIDLTEKEKR